MKKIYLPVFIILPALFFFIACNDSKKTSTGKPENNPPANQGQGLPQPYETKSTKNFSKVIGWKDGMTPVAPAGFTVTKFADGLDHPRWIYVGKNGDIFVAESNTKLKGVQKFGAKISRKIKTQHVGKS